MTGSRLRLGALALGMVVLLAPSSSHALPTELVELVPRWSAFYGHSLTPRTPPSVGVYGGIARGLAIAVSPDGARTYVTGLAGDGNAAAIAYDTADGAELWVAHLPDPGGWGAADIAVSPDGTRVYVTTEIASYTGRWKNTITSVAYDAEAGTRLWTARYDKPAPGGGIYWGQDPQRLAVSPEGTRVYVAVGSGTVAYDATNGSQLWVAPVTGVHLAVGPDDTRVYVSGASSTVALDALDGSQIWVAPGTGWDGDFAIAPDGASLYVVGWKTRLTTSSYDALHGSLRWSFAAYDHSYTSYYHEAELAVGHYGVYVTVTEPNVTLAFDDQGLLKWLAPNSLPGRSITLTVSPDYRVYLSASSSSWVGVTPYPIGWGYRGSGSDLVVYDYLGNEVSTTSFEAEWSDVAVSSDGSRLFSTGSVAQQTIPGTEARSWATVAFCLDVNRVLYALGDADIPTLPACLTEL